MNQEKIGRFIAENRKKQKLTQEQLAQKLNITYKAVSKWETGRALPDPSIMMDLCNILNINVNELFKGEKIKNEDYMITANETLIKIQQQKQCGIKAAKYTFIATIVVFLIWNFINMVLHGVQTAISMPEFIVMNIITFIYFSIYLFYINKK